MEDGANLHRRQAISRELGSQIGTLAILTGKIPAPTARGSQFQGLYLETGSESRRPEACRFDISVAHAKECSNEAGRAEQHLSRPCFHDGGYGAHSMWCGDTWAQASQPPQNLEIFEWRMRNVCVVPSD
jgi:hypothetical protein